MVFQLEHMEGFWGTGAAVKLSSSECNISFSIVISFGESNAISCHIRHELFLQFSGGGHLELPSLHPKLPHFVLFWIKIGRADQDHHVLLIITTKNMCLDKVEQNVIDFLSELSGCSVVLKVITLFVESISITGYLALIYWLQFKKILWYVILLLFLSLLTFQSGSTTYKVTKVLCRNCL